MWKALRNVLGTLQGERPRRQPRRVRPQLEGPLEERCTPATFTVNTLADTVDVNPGDGSALDANNKTSLRAAIQEANALAGVDVINFSVTGTIELGITLDSLNSDISILGPGDDNLTITRADGAGNFGIFRVNSGKNCMITDLSITGGAASEGGGIYNEGTLLVADCDVSGNSASDRGGGIFNAGTLSVEGTLISENEASDQGGGIYNADGATLDVYLVSFISFNEAVEGGGIYNYGTASVYGNTEIDSNEASLHGGGIYTRGDLTVEDCSIESNVAGFNGGGVYVANLEATFENVNIMFNNAHKGGGVYGLMGDMYFTDSTITHNLVTGVGALGPGICYVPNDASYTLTNCSSQGQTPDN